MENGYIKEGRDVKEKSKKEIENELVLCVMSVKKDLENAIRNYEFAEEDLIDYYLYEIKANQSKLDYLIRTAKEMNVVGNIRFKGKRVV